MITIDPRPFVAPAPCEPIYIVLDMAPVMPLRGFPPGQFKIKQRWNAATEIFVRTPSGIERFKVQDCGDHWQPIFPPSARNLRSLNTTHS